MPVDFGRGVNAETARASAFPDSGRNAARAGSKSPFGFLPPPGTFGGYVSVVIAANQGQGDGRLANKALTGA
jgi:hypothetical protein